MEDPSAHPVRPASPREPVAFNDFSWRELHEAGDPESVGGSSQEQTLVQVLSSLPDWVVISAGGLVAAILGALVGGALHI